MWYPGCWYFGELKSSALIIFCIIVQDTLVNWYEVYWFFLSYWYLALIVYEVLILCLFDLYVVPHLSTGGAALSPPPWEIFCAQTSFCHFPMILCCQVCTEPDKRRRRRVSYRRRSRLQTLGSLLSPRRRLHKHNTAKQNKHSQIVSHKIHPCPQSRHIYLFYCPIYRLYHCCSFTLHWFWHCLHLISELLSSLWRL